MHCAICFRLGGTKLPFLCAVDARNQLYEPRLAQAHILLEKTELDQQIEAIVTAQDVAPSDHDYSYTIERDNALTITLEERTKQIIARADELRAQIAAAKEDIAKRKAEAAQRRVDLMQVQNGVEPRRSRLLEDTGKKTKMTTFKWNQLHVSTVAARAFLCGEAAGLYNLQRLREPDGSLSDNYSISGVPILDLRAMCNRARPAEITSSLSQISQLLVLTTHYLSIRLPAEITLPHRDYPLPTIFKLKESYKTSDIPFPGNGSHSSNNSPTSSRHDDTPKQPTPRPLFINKPLPALSKEDLCMFLEGAALLAYNIAWVCKSQGCTVGSNPKHTSTTVEDVCELGGNLHRLLLTRTSPSNRHLSRQATPVRTTKQSDVTDSEDNRSTTSTASNLGQFSHGTAHTFLNDAQGTSFQRTFKLPSWNSISDSLKSHVLSEIAGTGWTLVGDDAALEAEDDPETGDGVMVGGGKAGLTEEEAVKRRQKRKVERLSKLGNKGLSDFGAASFMTMRTVGPEGEELGDVERRGNRGWTLIKDRA